MEDYSYLGSGIVLIREHGSNGAWAELGNTSAFSISPEVNSLQLADFQNPGGGIQNRVDRVTNWNLNLTFHDINAANLARFTRGHATEVAAGSVTAEAHRSYKGSWIPLKYPALAVTSVEPAGGGTAYEAGTDYIVDRGMLFIPATSTIPDATTTDNIEVDYTHGAMGRVEAGVTAQKFFEIQLHSANEARSGKRVQAVCHKVSGGMLETLALLGDEYAGPSVTQSITKDASKRTGANVSEYFYWNQEK
ncbi:MAG: hypothetical protein GX856_03820 [Gammaproteobacteria bacterium]|jgi:hypothetical protein|nr:hypothetical protein [Gammaproteobacteria bacterium]